ncbi:MAG: hypothetical protein ABSE59_01620 [Opitutaceae bacterium]
MAALLSQGFQEIAILSQRGKIQEAKSLASALAPILVSGKDPKFDLAATAANFARHHQGYPPTDDRTDWYRVWTGFVSDLQGGRSSVAA